MTTWVEIWIDWSAEDYVLLLRQVDHKVFEVVDPQDGRRVIERFDDYDEAVRWLREDEYEIVEGRWTPIHLRSAE